MRLSCICQGVPISSERRRSSEAAAKENRLPRCYTVSMLEGADYVPPKEEAKPTIQFLPEYGVHTSKDVTIVSSPTWEQAATMIQDNELSGIVLLPELITTASDTTPNYTKESVDNALRSMLLLSQQNPDATFVVGSPHFAGGVEKPYNAAYVMKNGEVLDIAHKHMVAEGEEDAFSMDYDQDPVTVGNTGIAICRDAVGVALPPDFDTRADTLESYMEDDRDKAADLLSVTFVDPTITRLIIPATWGMGVKPTATGYDLQTQEGINQYHKATLAFTIQQIFEHNPHIQEIILADRAPISKQPVQDRVTTRPLSLIAHR